MLRRLLLLLPLIPVLALAQSPWTVLPGVQHGNMTIFPVTGGAAHDTQRFVTLDEAVRSGAVVVSESNGGEVNNLSLVNRGDHPLLLLAGEIVTGGKQDRVVGTDRIVPPHSKPIDLSVFCVEHGRWTFESPNFSSLKSQMAGPSVRQSTMVAKSQQEVWARAELAVASAQSLKIAPGAVAPPRTTSYAKTMASAGIAHQVQVLADNYDDLARQLAAKHAKGIVVAINGHILWADLFASEDLLTRYWQKLIRSYASDAILFDKASATADRAAAQRFVDTLSGAHETSDTSQSTYRSTEITGNGYKVFVLTALLPDTG